MKISDFLSASDVFVDVRASDKQQLLQELARKAAARLNLPADGILSELLKREQLGSTGVGQGVALPHARFQSIDKPFGIIAKLKPAIDFDAIDGQPVDLVFVLLLPTAPDGERLGALASVARKLRAGEDLVKLRRAKRASDIYAALTG